jgi:amidase
MHTVNRRTFLKASGLGSVTAFAPRAGLSAVGVSGHTAQVAAPVAPFELEEVSIGALQERMTSGAETSRSITEKYLARIAALDRQGPSLRQVLETNPEALAVAAERDEERKSGRVRGPLHGVPILLKDNIGTADQMTTTAGSLALEGSIPAKDSFVAQKLREAGAVLLGKTNMSEWANFRSTHSTSGWSGRGGLGRNPYALDRNTSGSSSGSGAAVAASYAAAAIGTETDGSIVSPANNNCVVGIKPTLGLVSRVGIIPIAHTQDTAGPMARTVADAAAVLTAIAGFDPADPETQSIATSAIRDYTKALVSRGLTGTRIGVPRKSLLKSLFGGSTHADRLADAALAVLKSLGAEVIDPVELTMPANLGDNELEVLLFEFKADLNTYLASLGPSAGVKSLKEAIAFNEANKDREMPYFGQELFLQAESKGPLTSAAYMNALRRNKQATRDRGIDAVMTKHRLDALVAPTSGPPWLTDLVVGDYGTSGASSIPAVAGYPHVTVPAGFVFGLPVGVSFIGRAWSEMTLIRIAYAFEQATKHRKPPQFLTTADL